MTVKVALPAAVAAAADVPAATVVAFAVAVKPATLPLLIAAGNRLAVDGDRAERDRRSRHRP